jgi:hypothetical protein
LRGAEQHAYQFANHIRTESRAVVNLWPSLLAEFLRDGKALYSNYVLQVEAEARIAASMEDDRRRRGVEGVLFGSIAPQIRYAALTLDNRGLVSYGKCSMHLSNIAVSSRATVLEENSFDFVERKKIRPGKPIPAGHRALWDQRDKLAIAKLGGDLKPEATRDDDARLLLYSDGDRTKDRFMEVHVYGAFNWQAVESLTIPIVPTGNVADDA